MYFYDKRQKEIYTQNSVGTMYISKRSFCYKM